MVDPRRSLHLLVATTDGRVLVTGDPPALPTALVEPGGGTTVAAAVAWLRDVLVLDAPVMEVFFDYEVDMDGGPIPTLVMVEGPDVASADGWVPPADQRWVGLDGGRVTALAGGLSAGLVPRARRLLAEIAGLEAIPALRPPWSRPGWYARTTAWTTHRLEQLGRPPTGPLQQVRHWGISALGTIPTAAGPVWCKTVFPLFAHEPLVTKLLHDEAPGSVAPVVAARREPGYLLMDDIGSTVLKDHPDADADAIRLLVALQRRFIGRTADLRAVGCPDRSLGVLADLLADGLADPVLSGPLGVEPGRAAALVAWVREHASVVDDLGIGDTLVHGDFHPENVVLVDGRPVIFDWSDSPVGNPLVDILTWIDWFDADDRERADRAWRSWLDAWSDICPPERIEAVRETLLALAAAYHLTSYMGIVRALEPERRPEHHSGMRLFFGKLDEAVPGRPTTAVLGREMLHDD